MGNRDSLQNCGPTFLTCRRRSCEPIRPDLLLCLNITLSGVNTDWTPFLGIDISAPWMRPSWIVWLRVRKFLYCCFLCQSILWFSYTLIDRLQLLLDILCVSLHVFLSSTMSKLYSGSPQKIVRLRIFDRSWLRHCIGPLRRYLIVPSWLEREGKVHEMQSSLLMKNIQWQDY